MNLRRILLAAIAAALSLTAATALAGDDLPKPAVKRAAVVKEVSQSKKESSTRLTPRFWRRVTDQPCDSTACRPFRFAWSPVAPGA